MLPSPLLLVATACLAIPLPALVSAADAESAGHGPAAGRPLPPRYEPAGAGVELAPYDLAQELIENERKRSARQAHNITPFLLVDYLQAHHQGAEFSWQRPIDRGFFFIGTRNPNPDSLQQVYLGWQSYADGLQWGFTEIEILRCLGADPFDVVADSAVREKIRSAAGPGGNAGDWDVFLERSRKVFTDQRADRLRFGPAPHAVARYGVWADGRARFFSLDGEPL